MKLGQGHHGFDNNWWIGDKWCSTLPTTGQFACDLCGVQFFAGNNDHEFVVNVA